MKCPEIIKEAEMSNLDKKNLILAVSNPNSYTLRSGKRVKLAQRLLPVIPI